MPTFAYAARSRDGKTQKGTMSADSRQALMQMLQSRGLTPDPASIRERGGVFRTNLSLRKVKQVELLIFTRQLATMINAGLPLLQSLDILAEQTDDNTFAKIIQKVGTGRRGRRNPLRRPSKVPPRLPGPLRQHGSRG